MNRPLISLIIPTRERAETLPYAIRGALEQESTRIEVVVSDNNSQDDTVDVVRSYSDPRLRYINTGQRVSMCDNWELALQHATGEYVIVIGDDDAVVPGALDRLAEMILSRPSQVFCWPLFVYTWPLGGRRPWARRLAGSDDWTQTRLDDAARAAVAVGGWRYYYLPNAYHSAVSREVLEQVGDETGRVFHSTQPDVFLSMSIPAFAKNAVVVDFPVTVPGLSPKSNGGAKNAESADGVLDTFLSEYDDYQFHPSLYPGAGAKFNMIPDAILVAKDLFPAVYEGIEFDYTAMWAYLCRRNLAQPWSLGPLEILRRRREIARFHPFDPARFVRLFGFHVAGELRQRLLSARSERNTQPCDVYEYARQFVGC